MANLKLVFTISSVLLALVFFNGIFSAMGRPLKKGKITSYENSIEEMGTVEDNILLWRRSIMENAADSQNPHDDEKQMDDFRPTDPGHSPGAGHSSPTPKDASNGAPRP